MRNIREKYLKAPHFCYPYILYMQSLKRSPWHVGLLSVIAFTKLFAAQDTVLTKLVFDSYTKQYDARFTDHAANFKFNVTNTWTNEMTIDRVQTSCGCTMATLPANPWHLAPGAHGVVGATVNLDGKGTGLLRKTVTFFISVNGSFIGTQVVAVKVNIPEPPAPAPLSAAERMDAMAKARADPQEIFKNPKCAACHVDQGRNVSVAKMYAADCGICHDSPNRASWVPDLHALKTPTNFDYWKRVIAYGKPHTMMPAFANFAGGPLTDDQIHSLAEYLNRSITASKPPPSLTGH
jgi:mono/diheme cytochrome c family protein